MREVYIISLIDIILTASTCGYDYKLVRVFAIDRQTLEKLLAFDMIYPFNRSVIYNIIERSGYVRNNQPLLINKPPAVAEKLIDD